MRVVRSFDSLLEIQLREREVCCPERVRSAVVFVMSSFVRFLGEMARDRLCDRSMQALHYPQGIGLAEYPSALPRTHLVRSHRKFRTMYP
jgi:hypothetical protein